MRLSTAQTVHRVVIGMLLAALASPPAAALEPDELLLIVNDAVPESRKLAEFYANARRVPPGRIVGLRLPVGDDITQAGYESAVAEPVRAFLKSRKLEEKVTCLVTFYGVPLRVGARAVTADEQRELAGLDVQRKKTAQEVRRTIEGLEARAEVVEPGFAATTRPAGAAPANALESPEMLARRAEMAYRALARHAEKGATPQEKMDRSNELLRQMQSLGGPASVVRAMAAHMRSPQTPENERKSLIALADQVQRAHDEVMKLQLAPYDPAARARFRTLVAQSFGQIELLRVLALQMSFLSAEQSGSALDSELALIWWPVYARAQWQSNPLHHAAPPSVDAAKRRTLMVSRLDAPQAGQVSAYILASLKAERDGLKGRMVLDSRNIPNGGHGSYGWYDQSLRALAELVRTRTDMKVLLDDSADLLPANAADEVALYCGWYSLRHYVPSVKLNPGAVAFHVASAELVSLRMPNEPGWVAGLINGGAAASLGPVAEPYLFAFPPADEFFPLLMTGKLTLAECYWRTQSTTSWQVALVGDPLYRPYQKDPPLAVDELPAKLKKALEAPATQATPP